MSSPTKRMWSPVGRSSMTRHQSIAMLPSTAGVFVNGCVATGMFSAANLSAPSADRPAAIASSCWASCSSETLNSREAWMSRVVRDPGCWAVLGGVAVDRGSRHRIRADVRIGPRGASVGQLHATPRHLLTGLVVLPAQREARFLFEVVVPLTERVPVPRSLGSDLGQTELVPDLERPFHVLLRRQRDRRPRFLETGIDEHPAVIGAIPVPDDVA